MMFWIYSFIIPIVLLVLILILYRPLTFLRLTKALSVATIPLVMYTLLIYFLESEEYINSGWSFYSLFIFLFPYFAVIILLNIIAKKKYKRQNR
jgi:hypothetical protein